MKTNMKELSKFLKWSVAGDGYVGYSTNNRDAYYSIERLTAHKDYIELVASKFVGLQDCTVNVKTYVRKDNGKEVISLRTSSHPIFSRIRERQYINSHRVIEPHMLTLLDWEAAAFLFMDDGSTCYNNRGSRITRISTCSYSFPEQEAIAKALEKKLGVYCSVNKATKNLYQLNILKKSQDVWYRGIEPFVCQSYGYKLPEVFVKGDTQNG